MHKLLSRQLRRVCGLDASELATALDAAPEQRDQALTTRLLAGLSRLFEHIDASYEQYDRDLNLRSRSLDLSSDELLRANERLREELIHRNETEAKLLESRHWFHTIFQESPIPIYVIGAKDGIIHDVNKAALALYGYQAEEMINHRITELDLLVDPRKYHDMHGMLEKYGQVVDFECQHRNRAGQTLDVMISCEIRTMGNENALIVQIVNITERKHAEHMLALKSFALNQVYEGVYLIDPTSHFVFVNDSACRALGYSHEELLGMTVSDVAPEYPLERFAKTWDEIKEKGSAILHAHHHAKDGRSFPVEVSANYFEFDGRAYNLTLARDISERRRTEEMLRNAHAELEKRVRERTAKLEQANKELESFSYSVSHDLRAPLRAISGFAQILVRRHRGDLAGEARQYLDRIVAAAEHMGHLIEDILHYSRTGQGAVRTVAVSLEPLSRNLTATFEERIADAGARFEVTKPLVAPLGDPTLIEQVLNNLMDNALTYRCREGTPVIGLSAVREGGEAVIRLADNGIGIPPQYHQKIFQVFQRLHNNDKYPGTGIGLAVVAKAVHLMQGRIDVDSAPGQGSTFTIRLPAADMQEA